MKNNHRLLLMLFISVVLTSCQFGRFVIYNFADINDHKKFPSRTILKDSTEFHFHRAAQGQAPSTITTNGKKKEFSRYLEDNKTVAFIIIRNDTIQFEQYFGKQDERSIVPSFSIAKSITSLLIGCAIDDGLIASVHDPITQYLPYLQDEAFTEVNILHLLQMTSGIKFNESYWNPFGDAASIYYGRNLKKFIARLKVEVPPGERFEYVSGNTQLLGLILQQVLKDKTISAYLQEKIWQPLGMEYDASWSIDKKKDGIEKVFCCVNARATDYAKIGRLYLNQGNWNGQQIVSQDWVASSTRVDTTCGSTAYYQYQWWIPNEKGAFLAEGILGQFIYVNPEKNLVMVRLGRKEGKAQWWGLFESIASFYP